MRQLLGSIFIAGLTAIGCVSCSDQSALSGDGGTQDGSQGTESDGAVDTGGGDGALGNTDGAVGNRDGAVGNPDGNGPSCGTCFVQSTWNVLNIEPCFNLMPGSDGGPDTVQGAVSTQRQSPVLYGCPTDPTMLPTLPWSADDLTADCPGHYRLCVTIKAGDALNPQPSDCTMAQSCAESDYAAGGQKQSWADLPAWITSTAQVPCAAMLYSSGGYAEMSVSGTATGCGSVSKVLKRVTYCPLTCSTNPSGPGCAGCRSGPVDAAAGGG
jgi:hypothetical protein